MPESRDKVGMVVRLQHVHRKDGDLMFGPERYLAPPEGKTPDEIAVLLKAVGFAEPTRHFRDNETLTAAADLALERGWIHKPGG